MGVQTHMVWHGYPHIRACAHTHNPPKHNNKKVQEIKDKQSSLKSPNHSCWEKTTSVHVNTKQMAQNKRKHNNCMSKRGRETKIQTCSLHLYTFHHWYTGWTHTRQCQRGTGRHSSPVGMCTQSHWPCQCTHRHCNMGWMHIHRCLLHSAHLHEEGKNVLVNQSSSSMEFQRPRLHLFACISSLQCHAQI